ncbi:MAG TPA: hypothetical protein VMM16_09190, partial [Verrucomicrobiae bacterium]|nr:hypothetical protein [Verrucomicrobiae bacterium]
MTTDPTTQTLAELQGTSLGRIDFLFGLVQREFEDQTNPEAVVHKDLDWWQDLRNAWLGRKNGKIARIVEYWLKPCSADWKPHVGRKLNELRIYVEERLETLRVSIESSTEIRGVARERFDLSLPGVERAIGTRHVIQQTFDELIGIFLSIGFSVVEGPEIETPYYNFEALNIPEHHPARDNMD